MSKEKIMITVEQTGSPIRRPADQKATLIGLGLRSIRSRKTLEDNPSTRGMIRKIQHLILLRELSVTAMDQSIL